MSSRAKPNKQVRYFKRIRKKRHPLHVVLIAFAMVTLWWGTWNILDAVFLHNQIVSGVIAIIVALLIFFLDDFRLKELE
jgi:hypothetical protein